MNQTQTTTQAGIIIYRPGERPWYVHDADGNIISRHDTCADARAAKQAMKDQESTMSTPEEQDHAELEPTHAPTCDCDACEQAYADAQGNDDFTTNPVLADLPFVDVNLTAGEIADALHDRDTRQHGHLRDQLRAAAKVFALALAIILPGHADAQQLRPGTSVIIHGSDCQVNHTFEDGSAIAHCRDHTVWAFDPDGNARYGIAPGTWVRQKHTSKGAYGR